MDPNSLPTYGKRTTVTARFFSQLHRYINLLRTRWWVLLLGIGLGIVYQLYFIRHAAPSYVSKGRMIVSMKVALPSGQVYMEEQNNFLNTQSELMRSDTVARRAVQRVLTESPRLHRENMFLQVTVSPQTSIFNLQVLGGNPDFTQAYLDAVMKEYMAMKKEMLQDTSVSTKAGLTEARAQLLLDLEKTKLELSNYGATNSEVYLQSQGNSAGDYLAGLTKQLADLKVELHLLSVLTLDENAERLSFGQQYSGYKPNVSSPASPLNSQPNANPSANSPRPNQPGNANAAGQAQANLVGSEEDYLKAKQMILMEKAQRDELSKDLRPKHPKMLALNQEIERSEKMLEIFGTQTAEQLKNRAHTLELQIQNMEEQIKVWEVKTVDITRKMSDYQAIKDRIQHLQSMADTLLTSEKTVDIEKQVSPESVAILEPATPAYAAPLDLVRRCTQAGFLGLLLGVGVLIFLNRLDDRMTSMLELEDVFDETVLGQIPNVSLKDKKVKVQIIQNDDERHALVESYRNLRSSLVFMSQIQPKTVVMTSAIPSDGKSMTSANLAVTIARAGTRVLLVDADLRRGMLHKQFAAADSPGLAEALEEELPWTSAVVPTSVPNLFLLPRGKIPRHPGDLFMKPAMKTLVDEAKAQYEFIVFDTPPVMAADDVSNLAPYVDGVIMVVRSSFTSARVARAALDLLYLRKAKVLGLVFNAVKPGGGEYYYYKYKEYYANTQGS